MVVEDLTKGVNLFGHGWAPVTYPEATIYIYMYMPPDIGFAMHLPLATATMAFAGPTRSEPRNASSRRCMVEKFARNWSPVGGVDDGKCSLPLLARYLDKLYINFYDDTADARSNTVYQLGKLDLSSNDALELALSFRVCQQLLHF